MQQASFLVQYLRAFLIHGKNYIDIGLTIQQVIEPLVKRQSCCIDNILLAKQSKHDNKE